jgi:hypothetical protein
MLLQLLHFLFSLANQFSVGVSAILALVWFAALGVHLWKKVKARQVTSRRNFGELVPNNLR